MRSKGARFGAGKKVKLPDYPQEKVAAVAWMPGYSRGPVLFPPGGCSLRNSRSRSHAKITGVTMRM